MATTFQVAAQSASGEWIKIGTIQIKNGRGIADGGVQKFFPAKTKGRENALKSAKWLASEGAVSADWHHRSLTIRTAKVA